MDKALDFALHRAAREARKSHQLAQVEPALRRQKEPDEAPSPIPRLTHNST